MSRSKGVSSREQTKYAILAYLSDGQKHGNSNIVEALNHDISKVTIYKYLYKNSCSLVNEGLVKRKAGSPEDSFRPQYCITKKGQNEYNKRKLKRKTSEGINEEIDNMTNEEITKRAKEIDNFELHFSESTIDYIKKTDPTFAILMQQKMQKLGFRTVVYVKRKKSS